MFHLMCPIILSIRFRLNFKEYLSAIVGKLAPRASFETFYLALLKIQRESDFIFICSAELRVAFFSIMLLLGLMETL